MDEALRAQERRARAGETGELLRYASNLERARGKDAALEALVAGRADLDVRRALERFPAWSHADGDAGATRAIDTPPLSGPPRLRWRSARLPEHQSRRSPGSWRIVAATPAAIVVGRRGQLTALDPESGETLWSRHGLVQAGAERFERTFVDRGALVQCRWHRVAWLDLRTGKDIAEARFEGGCLRADSRDGAVRLVTVSHPASRGRRFLRLLEATDGAEPTTRWERPVDELEVDPRDAFLAPDLVVLHADERVEVGLAGLSPSDGATRWTANVEAWVGALDPCGLVVHGPGGVTCVSPDGLRRWTADQEAGFFGGLALTADAVVCAGRSQAVWLDRSTGAARAEHPWASASVSAGRGQVYVCEWGLTGRLVALTSAGAVVWSRTWHELLGSRSYVGDVVPTRGRLVGVADRSTEATVVCLEGATSE